MEVANIKNVAGGRVWAGAQAVQHGLVDMAGGLDEAVRIAAQAAQVDNDYRVRYYPKVKTFAEQLLESLTEESESRTLRQELGAYYPLYLQFKAARNLHGVQARLPYELTLR
jgi:protease-4